MHRACKQPKQTLTMNSRLNDDSEMMMDRTTSRSICNAVGERLQRDLRPDAMPPSSHLEHLLDQLRRQDESSSGTNRVHCG
jgi:hypothetical protein